MASCDECKKLVEETLHALLDAGGDLGCIALAAEFDAACIIAAGGPEDPVGDVVCTVAAAELLTYCEKKGIDWIKAHIPDAAEDLCKLIGIC